MGREAKINKKLTRKQTTFVKELASGKSATQAAMVAYDVSDSKNASVIASQNLNKLSIREVLDDALHSQGLTPDVITANLGEIANSRPEKISGDTVLKANVELLKLHGAYPGKQSYQASFSAKVDLNKMTYQEAKTELDKLRARNAEILADIEESEPPYTPL